MKRAQWLADLIEQVLQQGVREFVVCAGARNALLMEVLRLLEARLGLTLHACFEERSAAFFALGRMTDSGKPVAVLTTSGTAAGELLPAMMEAYYTDKPLIAITADRPRAYRKTGAPQTAQQAGLYGVYAPLALDLAFPERVAWQLPVGPAHLNLCFEEPLKLTPEEQGWLEYRTFDLRDFGGSRRSQQGGKSLSAWLKKQKAPLVVVSGLREESRSIVAAFLERTQLPCILEPTSGLQHFPHLRRIYRPSQVAFDSLLRIGSVPVLRLWRDMEEKWANLPVFSISHLPWSGLARTSDFLLEPDMASLDLADFDGGDIAIKDWSVAPQLERFPRSELALMAAVRACLDEESSLFLGNSLPIREWDLVSESPKAFKRIEANRGLNGIDGQLSTLWGLAAGGEAWTGIFGDLTTLYDLTAPWFEVKRPPRVIVINNGGGKIFERMFPDKRFQNPHKLSFENWARMWQLPYACLESVEVLPASGVVEIQPDAAQSKAIWDALV